MFMAPNQALPAKKQRDFANNAQQADGMSARQKIKHGG
jgi:hypothetical protein